jgi:hypothetical protein
MGAVGSRFFSQEALFSEQPPMVTDFLEEEVTVCYSRAFPAQVMTFIRQQSQGAFANGVRQQEVQ